MRKETVAEEEEETKQSWFTLIQKVESPEKKRKHHLRFWRIGTGVRALLKRGKIKEIEKQSLGLNNT